MVSVAMLVYQSARNNGEKVGDKMWWMDMPIDLVISDETLRHNSSSFPPVTNNWEEEHLNKICLFYFKQSTK